MYVPFGKSVDDVTFQLSLRHFFCPRLKKTMEHNLCNQELNHYTTAATQGLKVKNYGTKGYIIAIL